MKIVILFIATLGGAHASAAEQLLHRAYCELASLPLGKEVPCFADVVKETTTQATELRIYEESSTGRKVFRHRLQEGQEFVASVGTLFLTGLGRVFYVEWEWGARTVGITLYKLGPDGQINEVFRDGGIYGYRIVKLLGADELKIIVLDRDEANDGSIARIYGVANGLLGKPSIVHTKDTFSFELKGSN